MNEFLKTREQINLSSQWLRDNGYINHPISCKDWELAKAIRSIGDGDLLDMGADGSFLLHNAIIKNIKGRKVGIDLLEVTGTNKAEGVEYFQGDLMKTPFRDNSFDTIVSLSVIEHEINYERFAKECSRLLRPKGKLIVSFDYFEPKPDTSKMKLYSLSWNILDYDDVIELIISLARHNLAATNIIDWTTQDAVINSGYCSPVVGVEYTFGMLEFVKVEL